MKLYICSKFQENIDYRFEVDTILKLIISKGHYPAKNIAGVTHLLMLLYICIKFHENILDGIKVIEQTRFTLEKFQRGIISQKL